MRPFFFLDDANIGKKQIDSKFFWLKSLKETMLSRTMRYYYLPIAQKPSNSLTDSKNKKAGTLSDSRSYLLL